MPLDDDVWEMDGERGRQSSNADNNLEARSKRIGPCDPRPPAMSIQFVYSELCTYHFIMLSLSPSVICYTRPNNSH